MCHIFARALETQKLTTENPVTNTTIPCFFVFFCLTGRPVSRGAVGAVEAKKEGEPTLMFITFLFFVVQVLELVWIVATCF